MKTLRTTLCAFVTAAVIASLGLIGCSGAPSGNSASDGEASAAAAEAKEFNLGYLNSTAHVLAFIAQEQGYFAEEGLDVTLTQFSSGSELVSGLEADKLDAAFVGSIPTIVHQANGHDITIFGGAMSNGHGYVIDSKYTEGLDSWDVSILKGKTVAVPRATIQDLELQQILTEYNLTYSTEDDADVKIIYFDSQKDAYAALASAEIDAASCYSPYTAIAVDAGYSVVYRCADIDIFQNQPCCRQVALTEDLEADPATYEAFERALIKAYETYRNDTGTTIGAVKKYIDIPTDQIDFELYEGYADSHPDPDKQATVALKKEAVAFGYVSDYDIQGLYNTSIYESALTTLIEQDSSNTIYQELKEHFETYE